MSDSKRRDFLKATAGVAAGAALGTGSALMPSLAAAAEYKVTPEKGAKLRLLRWKRFVQGDETLWMENTKKFTAKTGIPVQVDNESWEDVRPKAAVAANIGSGPDLILGWLDDPFQYSDKLVDVTDLANYLGAKYGGWYDICRTYGMHGKRWQSIPVGIVGNAIVYRDSLVKAAGFDGIPKDSAGFLKLCKALKAKGTPAGFAFGHAVGDGNTWCNWLLWQQGGKLTDEHNNVVINSPETIAALEYGKEMYETFIPGTLSWGDPSNNKAFLGGQISLTANGISIYYVAKDSNDPAMKAMAEDIQHTRFPIGPVGKPTEFNLFTQMMIFKYSKYPNAAKEYLRFMMEADQFNPWMKAAIGYVSQPLKAYAANPMWTADPKATPYRDVAAVTLSDGYAGTLGYASAAVMADYVVVDMFASVVSGAKSPKDAAALAEKQALRYYKV